MTEIPHDLRARWPRACIRILYAYELNREILRSINNKNSTSSCFIILFLSKHLVQQQNQ